MTMVFLVACAPNHLNVYRCKGVLTYWVQLKLKVSLIICTGVNPTDGFTLLYFADDCKQTDTEKANKTLLMNNLYFMILK